jgi:hypothetical protein
MVALFVHLERMHEGSWCTHEGASAYAYFQPWDTLVGRDALQQLQGHYPGYWHNLSAEVRHVGMHSVEGWQAGETHAHRVSCYVNLSRNTYHSGTNDEQKPT